MSQISIDFLFRYITPATPMRNKSVPTQNNTTPTISITIVSPMMIDDDYLDHLDNDVVDNKVVDNKVFDNNVVDNVPSNDILIVNNASIIDDFLSINVNQTVTKDGVPSISVTKTSNIIAFLNIISFSFLFNILFSIFVIHPSPHIFHDRYQYYFSPIT